MNIIKFITDIYKNVLYGLKMGLNGFIYIILLLSILNDL
jgi:hypothetical protein